MTNLYLNRAFIMAGKGEWQTALDDVDRFLARNGRESSNRLGARLILGQLLLHAGEEDEGIEYLKTLDSTTREPWYRQLASALAGNVAIESLAASAEANPENLLTYCLAKGLSLEAQGKKAEAARSYSQALESFRDTWLEYGLAKERLVRLRMGGGERKN